MKIALVDLYLSNDEAFSLGLLNLATILNSAKIDCEILNINRLTHIGVIPKSNDDAMQVANYILSCDYTTIGFSTMCNNYHVFLRIAKLIRQANPNINIFMGGPQATLTAFDTMSSFSDCINLISMGEAELTIIETVLYLEKVYKDLPRSSCLIINNEIIYTSRLVSVNKLDDLPKLDYSLIDYLDEVQIVNIEVGRGCPFSCSFCSTKTFWEQKVRYKSARQIIDDIKVLYYEHNKRTFNLIHDLFTARKGFVDEFCELLIHEDLDIEWSCSSRLDTLELKTLKLMKEANCRKIFFGIETGSQRMQAIICKNLKLNKFESLFQSLKDLKFAECTFSFIYGFPEEREDDFLETVKLIQRILLESSYIVMLSKCTILPGTKIYIDNFDKIEYRGEHTRLTNGCNLDIYDRYFTQHKKIFPYYYSFSTPFHLKYENFEVFLLFITTAHKLLPSSIHFLLTHMDNLMYLYNNLSKEDIDKLGFVFSVSSADSIINTNYTHINMACEIKDILINLFYLQEKSIFFYDLLNFEYELLSKTNEAKSEYYYKNDVVSYRFKQSSYALCINVSIKVIMEKKGRKILVSFKKSGD